MKDDVKQLSDFNRKFNLLISILLEKEAGEKKKIQSGIGKLRKFGFSNSEIADILGTTKRTVEVLVSKLGITKKR